MGCLCHLCDQDFQKVWDENSKVKINWGCYESKTAICLLCIRMLMDKATEGWGKVKETIEFILEEKRLAKG